MATKQELQEQAKAKGVEFNSKTTKAELEAAVNGSDETTVTAGGQESQPTAETQEVDSVKVNENESGEATNGTTKDGSEKPVKNTDSVPQNGVETVEVFETTDNEVAKQADAARTKEEVQFADESNPNNKSRVNSTQGEKYDQDGNLRTGGKSYGIADDDVTGYVFPEDNRGKEPEGVEDEAYTGRVVSAPVTPGSFLDSGTNAGEWDVERIQAEGDALSDRANGITAVVTTSTGDYVRIKFFYNNLTLGTFRSRNYERSQAEKFLERLKQDRGL